jgi:hypothetical protein
MNELVRPSSSLPAPRGGAIVIDVATMADLPALDALQKQFGRALGYFPTKQFEGYIEMGGVLVARASRPCMGGTPMPLLGYVISRDRYLKRDELGVIYQLCVAPGHQRGLIGATLVREVFARSAYGCKLYCCWCAQDLDANYFWESLGFVPIAFRAGSTGKKRVHIFWQRRVDREVSECGGVGVSECEDAHPDTPTPRHADTPRAAPYWYPFQTNAGAIREDRIVFPIPPGVHWQDVRAVEVARATGPCLDQQKERMGGSPMPRTKKPRPQHGAGQVAIIVGGRVKYVDRPGVKPATPAPMTVTTELAKPVKAKRDKPPKAKIDPTYLAAARELRDRWMERVNDDALLLPAPRGTYDVSRALPVPAKCDQTKRSPLLLDAA